MSLKDLSIACIGLGRMGVGIAQNVQASGCRFVVYNRTPEKMQPFAAAGAKAARSAQEQSNLDIVKASGFQMDAPQQERPTGVLQRAIHQPLGIRKDSQFGELFGHRPDVAFVVVGADADEHQQAGTDFPHVAAGDANAGAADSLNDGAH